MYKRQGYFVGMAMSTVRLTTHPRIIALGGGASTYEGMLEKIRDTFDKTCLPLYREGVEIVRPSVPTSLVEMCIRDRTKLDGLSEAEQDNLLLQQVVDVCRSRADNAFLQDESGADYIALMSMSLRARLVLMLADMLHLPDAVIAQVMHSRKDRVVRSLKEARADLVRRAASALGPHETAEQIIERNAEELTPQMVQGLWTRLGGKAEQLAGWAAPDMSGAVRRCV